MTDPQPDLPVRGMQIWASSLCRSTLATYKEIANEFNVPFRVCVSSFTNVGREELGFNRSEFSEIDIIEIADDRHARTTLREKKTWLQVFGSYQTRPQVRHVLDEALSEKLLCGIASEATSNMESSVLRRAAKSIYLSQIVPRRISNVKNGVTFFLNWSGDNAHALVKMGWSPDKIIPLGYHPPPLPNSTFKIRDDSFRNPLRLLCSGGLTWHRGPDIFLSALTLLKRWGVEFEATVTGSGPLEEELRNRARNANLPVSFLGTVRLENLVKLYETCTIFVAPGRIEPWGVRVNDALNCGAPVVVSRGMGSAKLVHDYGVGVSFSSGDVVDLAWQLRSLATDRARYARICDNTSVAREKLLPSHAAATVAPYIADLLSRPSR